jgi:hypothetical protein
MNLILDVQKMRLAELPDAADAAATELECDLLVTGGGC